MSLFGPPDVEKLESKRDVKGLIGALGYQKDPYGDLRRAAAEALGEIGDPRAVEPLIGSLKDDRVHLAAIKALDKINDRRAVEPLIGMLKSRGREASEAAAMTLGHLGDPRAIEPLVAALGNGPAAAEALIQIGDARAVDPLIGKLLWKNQWPMFRDSREAAAELLGRFGDPRAVEPLIAALKDQDRDVRKAAAEALGRLGDLRAVEPLLAFLGDIETGSAAIEALAKIGDPRAVEPLLAALADPRRLWSDQAAVALGLLGDPRAVGSLLIALEDRDWKVRRAAAQGLVAMYGAGQIDEIQRAAILIRRDAITTPRTHVLEHSDYVSTNYAPCGGGQEHHDANDHHVDEGFGVEFPI